MKKAKEKFETEAQKRFKNVEILTARPAGMDIKVFRKLCSVQRNAIKSLFPKALPKSMRKLNFSAHHYYKHQSGF